ncbi:hypothetical protein COLO4_23855 [Corchorus olitorius]|uniref:DUF7054 domain-containing protein n=1 Tax=Corchorus olitorius TaxID=93759 RepID=A0A1R3IED9_9ROSI|nr:hypothetical protein COLO4_23855 [Corchorus olitorius]
MVAASPSSRRLSSIRVFSSLERSHTFPKSQHDPHLVGLDEVPAGRLTTSLSARARFPAENDQGPQQQQRLTKLLLKVNIEKSLGPLHVVMPSDNTVNDLIKAAIQIYVKEKRRPLLQEIDPKFFQLHYSAFSLESLKPEEKLMNLGSRNFFLYMMKPSSSVTSCGPQEAKMASKYLFPLTKLMEFMM